ncbi:glycosyltransferase family 1 protein [Compostibacter hankyongensis]|uniref:Glycosyltransferase family 1 protein n=1 Tax=Compostibacter hankyongensis TaxID=1007089 RepID=A0ABP8FW31_9BACT
MKKRIAFISEHASPLATLGGTDCGGQNVYVGELARHIARLGFDIDIFTRKDDEQLAETVCWIPGVRVIHIKSGPEASVPKEELMPYMKEFTGNMLAFIRRENPGYALIHANFWMSAMVAADLKKILGIPFVVTFHALGYIRKLYQKEQDRFPPERVRIETAIVQEADHVIAECPQDREDLIGYYAAAPEKISIIPCGFNPQEFYPVERALARMVLNLDPEEKILLQLGRMVPRKGVENVILALKHLKHRRQPVRLLVVGGGSEHPGNIREPEIARLTGIAREAGVLPLVTFAGRRNRDVLKYYYAAADIFVTTPWYEPFGITPLEAMACGIPVIGSDVGGIRYSVADGKTGFLVPPHDPVALARRALMLLNDARLAGTMSRNALQRVNTLFTWAGVAGAAARLYEKIMLPRYSMIS